MSEPVRRALIRASGPMGFFVGPTRVERPRVPAFRFRPTKERHPLFLSFTPRELELAAGFGVIAQ